MRTIQLSIPAAVCLAIASHSAQAATETVLRNFAYFPDGAIPYGTLARGASGKLYGTTYQGGTYSLGVVFEWSSSGYKVLHSFKGAADGANPYAGVVIDASENLYGTTYYGGPANAGVVYKIATDGTETVLYAFTGGADGGYPYAGVTLDSSGNVYGTTNLGGSAKLGVVYKVSPTGQETVIHSFTGQPDGANPYGGVTFDAEGNLYGTTPSAGAFTYGAIFKITPAGQESILYSFAGGPKGSGPHSGLIRDSAGNFYGTANAPGAGLIYKITPSGSFKGLHEFPVTNISIETGLAIDTVGNLYGTTQSRGSAGLGIVYELTAAGEFETLFSFPGPPSGARSIASGLNGAVIVDSAGNVYGTTAYAGLGGIVFERSASGGAKTLYSFPSATYGSYPFAGLAQDAQGNLYGNAGLGGRQDWGVLYKLTPAGEQVLYNYPYDSPGGVALDSAGNLYGTSTQPEGNTVLAYLFRLSPTGQFTPLHAFTGGSGGLGCYTVIADAAGNLYGASGPGKYGDGLIFKLSPSGEYTVLHSFTGGADGNNPNNFLTLDAAGNLYGTTNGGGIGAGVVFKITPLGAFSVLYTFTAQADGGYPLFGVAVDSAGNLYGTTAGFGELSGGKFGSGVVFELETNGTYNVLYTFTGGADGGGPQSLVRDSAGNLYGTTEYNGDSQCETAGPGLGCGVVFQLATTGAFSVLHAFTGGDDGAVPYAGPILGSDGSLYGTTGYGGTANAGVVYKITP